MTPLLTPAETAAILKTSTRTVYRLIKDGELRKTLIKSEIKINVKDLEEYVENARQQTMNEKVVSYMYDLKNKRTVKLKIA